MLLLVVVLTLTLQPALSLPCVEVLEQTRYETFLEHHLNNNIPEGEDIRVWQTFIDSIKTWNRPIQSFFPVAERDKVIRVCSTGGKRYGNDNLCISNEPFNFITVSVDNNKKVTRVTREIKHVILACEKIKVKNKNKCRPVHFEPNKDDAEPESKPNCSEASVKYKLYS